ncbi:Hypothetical protein A7982_07420 [Minicystis rosea]|nr:Hypothetical protein A7982_07420 [Minicystis rosea]
MGPLVAGLLAGGVLVSFASTAAADWPMSRRDAQRTASATGKSNIITPMPTWRFPLGGAMIGVQAMITDTNGDLSPEFYFIRGSSAMGKRLDDSTIFQTPSVGLTSTRAVVDLDGDGKPELVSDVGTNQTAVVDASTGAIEWLQSPTELGCTSATRIADLNGDGIPDLLLQDGGCCAMQPSIPGAVYTFVGNAKTPKLLWQLPYAHCGGGNATTILDADGDGKLDVLMGRNTGFDLLDGATGQIKASINFKVNPQGSLCMPARLTGGPGEQAVCTFGSLTSDDHNIFAIAYSPSPTPSLKVLWDKPIGAPHQYILPKPGIVADLDGDGLQEITVTAQTSATSWSTFVIDGATGATLSTLDGHKLVGTAPILASGRSVILTEESNGTGGWSFKRKPVPSVTQLWQIAGQGPLGFYDHGISEHTSSQNGIVSLDLTGDGTPDLITGDVVDGTVRVLDTSAGTTSPPVVGSLAPATGMDLLWAAPATLQNGPVLATGFSDGVFRLKVLKNGTLIDAAPPGVHFDGYFATSFWRTQGASPVVGKLRDGEMESVILTDAGGTLHVLDASKANAKTPPVERWSRTRTTAPIILPHLKGSSAGVVILERQPIVSNPPKMQVTALDADGVPLWTSPIDGNSWSDLVAGNVDGDGKDDVFLSWGAASDGYTTLRTRAIAGASGATLWEAPPTPIVEVSGPAVHDWDGDGKDDLFFEMLGLHVLSGASGVPIGPTPIEKAQNGMPIITDLDGDGAPEVVLQGGYAKVTVLSSDLESVHYTSNDTQNTMQYGAIAHCPDGDKLVESTYFYHTSRLTITDLAVPSTGKVSAIFLAGGQKFPDEASATAAGVFQGVLTAVSVHENLTGLGHPTAVVGSTGGWLYGIDPCTENVDFAYDFKDAVGSVIFGDTDGDGLDEILVEVSDGYLYDLKQKVDDPGTGGTGGTSTSSSGSGGTGGTGGTGGKPQGDDYLINGRVTCFCATPGDRGDATLGLSAFAALGLAMAARRRPKRR